MYLALKEGITIKDFAEFKPTIIYNDPEDDICPQYEVYYGYTSYVISLQVNNFNVELNIADDWCEGCPPDNVDITCLGFLIKLYDMGLIVKKGQD